MCRARDGTGDCHCQRFSVALARTRKPGAQSRDWHSESSRGFLLIRRRDAHARDERSQFFKPLSSAFCHNCILQMLPGPLNDIRRPDKIVASGVAEMSGRQHRCLGLRQMLLDRHDLTAATSLERSGAVILIEQEILQRSPQERAKPTLSLIRAAEPLL